MFYGADGQPWFRLDEQRHDVPLDADLARSAARRRRDRGSALLLPSRHRSDRRRARGRPRRAARRAGRGRQHAHAAARAHAVPVERPDVRPQGRRKRRSRCCIEAQLTKTQILELYLNRVYLSAGVYGVETMSEHLFRKPARTLTLPEAALIAGLIRAPSTLSPWSNYDGALERSHVVLAQMREQGFITRGAGGRRRARVRPRIQPYRQPSDARAGVGEGISAPAVPQRVRRRPSAGLAGAHVVPPGAAGRGRAGGRRGSGAPQPSGASRPRSSRSIRRPATSWRWSAAANYRAEHLQSRDAQPPAAGLGVQAVCLRRRARARLFAGLRSCRTWTRVSAPGDPEWRPRSVSHRPKTRSRLAHAARRAARIEQCRRRRVCSSGSASRTVLHLADERGLAPICPTCRRWRSAPALVTPLDLTAAYTMFPGGGQVAQPRGIISVFDADGSAGVRRSGRSRARRQRRRSPFQMVSMLRDVIERGTGAPARALGVRGAVAGKTGTTDDYHDAWFVGFSIVGRRRRLGRASISRRRSAATPTARASRCRSGPTS